MYWVVAVCELDSRVGGGNVDKGNSHGGMTILDDWMYM